MIRRTIRASRSHSSGINVRFKCCGFWESVRNGGTRLEERAAKHRLNSNLSPPVSVVTFATLQHRFTRLRHHQDRVLERAITCP